MEGEPVEGLCGAQGISSVYAWEKGTAREEKKKKKKQPGVGREKRGRKKKKRRKSDCRCRVAERLSR